MKRRRQQQTNGVLEWIEEATHLLRTSPLSVIGAYYIGALPFILGLLFFWADMSRSPFAKQHVVEAALGMALLFLWMKTWQSVFCLRLRALISGEPMEPLTLRRCLGVFVAQATIQPAGLLLIPIALVLTLPFAWVFSFYQNATALAEPGMAEGQSLFKRSALFTKFWAGQYHVILGLLSIFAFVVFLNWAVVCMALPSLLKTLLGTETVFSRSPMALLNTTFFAAMGGLTYLCVDPVVKALHVLRCFRGESQTTGDDLKSELRHVALARGQAALLAIFLLIGCVGQVRGAEGVEDNEKPISVSPPVATPGVQSAPLPSPQLDKTIEEVINQQKYTWRMPREQVTKKENEEEGYFAKFFERTKEMLKKWARAIGEWLDKLFNKVPRNAPAPARPGNWIFGLAPGLRLLLYALVALAVVGLLYLVYRLYRDRNRGPEVVEAAPMQPVPDLTDENVGAEQLPEDEWTRLARELLARGEFRLALRAYYLSSLAYLAQRQLITLAKFKSNRDYERELARRGHALAEMPAMFSQNVNEFDRVWYGAHAVDGEVVGRFASNVERIRSIA